MESKEGQIGSIYSYKTESNIHYYRERIYVGTVGWESMKSSTLITVWKAFIKII